MTRVKFFRSDKGIKGFQANGHAGFAAYGEDIVCAAISALTQAAVLGLQEVVGINPDVDIQDGYLRCCLPEHLGMSQWQDSQVILATLYRGLKAIAEEYGDFLQIEEV